MDSTTLENSSKIGDVPVDYTGANIGQRDESRFLDNESYTPAPSFLDELVKKEAA